MKSKKLFIAALILLLVAFFSADLLAATYTIRFAGQQPPDHPLTAYQWKFKELAEEYSDGEIEVKVYHSNQLGGNTEANEAVRDGSIQMAYSSIAYISSNFNPKFYITNLPFLVTRNNVDDFYELVDGEVGQRLGKELEKNNIRLMAYIQLGFRNVTNSVRPVLEPNDLEGLKIRLQPNEVHVESFRAFGANPISMDWSEVYSALQQGVIDGQENPIDIIYLNNFFETQDYCTLTGHFFDIGGVYMNLDFYNNLPEDIKEIINKAGFEAAQYQRQVSTESEKEYIEKLKEKMEVIDLPEEGLKKFQEKSEVMYEKIRDIVKDDQLVDDFLNALR